MSENENNKPEQTPKEQEDNPVVFLILAGVMLLVALLSYIFEEALYDINHSTQLFVLLILGSLAFALFFLTCYRVPRLGRKFLGKESGLEPKKSLFGDVTYNVFKSDNPAEEIALASRRKKVRQTRRSFKNEKVQINNNKKDNDAEKAE